MRAAANNKSRRSKHSKKPHFQQQGWSPEIISHRWGKLQAQQQQRNNKNNNKTSHTVGGTLWLKCCFCFNVCTKTSRNPCTPLGERKQQRNNKSTTSQQQMQQQNISHRWGDVVSEVFLLL
jgi:hypothetical protein